MKTIQIISDLRLAGGQIMCENLSCELQRQGESVKIVSLYSLDSPIVERLRENNIEVIFLDKKSGLDISIIWKLRRILKKEKPDIIHTHLNAFLYLTLAKLGMKTGKIVHTFHSVAYRESLASMPKFIRNTIKRGKATPVALSDTVQQSISEMYGLSRESIPVVLNGLDLKKCQPKVTYSIGNEFNILHIGRFSSEKNHAGLIRSFKIFHTKYPSSRLCLIGDGALRGEVEELVRDEGLSDSVDFMGKQGNVYPYLNRADVFILPSLVEGIPITLIEAMGTGLPIVATRVGGIPDMIQHDENGLLCEVDDAQIAACLERYYLDEELRQKHGWEALKGADRFSSVRMAKGYLEVYRA